METLATLDYVVFISTLLVSLGIGVYHACWGPNQNNLQQYVLGNRKLKIFPVALSLTVSFQSSIMLLGNPTEIYVYGIPYIWQAIGLAVSNLFALVSIVPLIHPLKVTSFYDYWSFQHGRHADVFVILGMILEILEYFQRRFHSRIPRILATIMGILYNTFYMGIVLFGPGIAIETVTNFPMWTSVLVVAFSAIIYTAVGGLRAVVWTDVFQFIIMFIGIFSIIIKATIDVGGMKAVFDFANEGMRFQMPSFDPDPTVRNTMWSLVVGSSISLTYILTTQTTIQRICSVPTQRDARKVVIISTVSTVINFLLSCLLGIFAYSYFHKTRCDPIESEAIQNPNQILPYLVVVLFRDVPGMAGLFIAALFSASLSTISSLLSSLSAQTVEDIVKPLVKDLSESRATLIAKISVFVYGIIGIAISFMIANISGPLSQITYSLLSSFGGAAAGMFFFAAFCPWANSKGTVAGGISGMVLVLWIALGKSFSSTMVPSPTLPAAPVDMCWSNKSVNITSFTSSNLVYNITNNLDHTTISSVEHVRNQGLDVLYSLSYYWMTPLSILTTILVGTLVSFLTGRPDPSEVDVQYMLPVFDYCCPCLPERLRQILYCGAGFGKRQRKLGETGCDTEKQGLNLQECGLNEEETSVLASDTKTIQENIL